MVIVRFCKNFLMRQNFNRKNSLMPSLENVSFISIDTHTVDEQTWLLPPAYVVRGKVMFWHASVHPSICLSTGGGYPYPIMLCNISQNAMRQRRGWVPGPPPGGGGTRVRYPPRGGYPGRTTEGVLTTRRAVCLLRSRRRTFFFFC